MKTTRKVRLSFNTGWYQRTTGLSACEMNGKRIYQTDTGVLVVHPNGLRIHTSNTWYNDIDTDKL